VCFKAEHANVEMAFNVYQCAAEEGAPWRGLWRRSAPLYRRSSSVIGRHP
jgi:hypothetical protein